VDDWSAGEVPTNLAAAPGPDYPHGQCTEFAARTVRERTGFAGFYFPRAPGDPPRHAKSWPMLATAAGIASGSTPRVNAVAVFTDGIFATWGHVAVVTDVYGDQSFDVIESNWPRPLTVGTRSHLRPETVTTFLYPTAE